MLDFAEKYSDKPQKLLIKVLWADETKNIQSNSRGAQKNLHGFVWISLAVPML